jgi:hypothetical protein
MIKRLSDRERLDLKYKEILAKAQGAAYPDTAARETAYMSVDFHHREEMEDAGNENKSWFQQMEGWEES